MPLVDPNALPYRPCAGIVLLNPARRVWIGRRFHEFAAEERIHRWQMPQGGIDEHEDPIEAAKRELYEETGVKSVEVLDQTKDWIAYDLPPEAVGVALQGKYRGQRQKWVAMLFYGEDSEINLNVPGCHAEFDAWRWAHPRDVLAKVVAFKRPTYEAVFAEFAHLLHLR